MLSVRFICLLVAMQMLAVSASFKAEDGYVVFPTFMASRYKLTTNLTTWAEGVAACQVDGGGSHLVILNSQEEATVVSNMITANHYVFAGINDIVVEGLWLTIEGGRVADSGYNKWQSGQPDDNKGNEDCGAIRSDGRYNDVQCNSMRLSICEKPNI